MRTGLILLVAAFYALGLALPGGQALSAGVDVLAKPDTAGDVGRYPSLKLDASGNPVVAYGVEPSGLRLLHCDDPFCSGVESIETISSTALIASLELDASGNPVLAFFEGSTLNVVHCNDPDCSGGGESVTTPQPSPEGGGRPSLELDAGGNPVILYVVNSWVINILHCNDPNCAGLDESITTPASGAATTQDALALDLNGYPVVAFEDLTSDPPCCQFGGLRLLHCGDADCASGNTIIAKDPSNLKPTPQPSTKRGRDAALVIDGSGNPVISSYQSFSTTGQLDLRIAHCNDSICNGATVTMPDTASGDDVGKYSSLVLDAGGRPVVAYFNESNGMLKIMHCDDANCAGGGEAIIPLVVGGGRGTSIALDTDGHPVIAFYDQTDADLNIIHCANPFCFAFAPVGGIAQLPDADVAAYLLAKDASGVSSLMLAWGLGIAVAVIVLGTGVWVVRRPRE